MQDMSGSEKFDSINRMYYRGAWAAIVCYGECAVGGVKMTCVEDVRRCGLCTHC